MSLFSNYDEYAEMAKAQKQKPHLKNLERERQEREREREARSRCIHPRCMKKPEDGQVGSDPARPWVGTGLCPEHYRRHFGEDGPTPHLKKQEAELEKRAVYAERQEWSGNV